MLLGLDKLVQLLKHRLQVTDYRHVHVYIFADFGGINVDMDNAGMGGESTDLGGGPIIKSHPDGNNQISSINGHISIGHAMHTEHTVAQGMGFGLMEDYLEVQGVPWTWTLHEYLVPTSKDVPDIEPIVLQSKSGKGPFGAKGIGEPAITAAAPAVVNAIRDAIGVRISHIPATPERIFFALREKEDQ